MDLPNKTPNYRRNMIIFASVLLVISLLLLFWQILFPFSWDNTDFWLKIVSGVLAVLTVLVGTITIISGYYLGERQAENIRMQEENIETLRGDNLKLQSSIEQDRITRLQLEESLEPRILISNDTTRDTLKSVAGTPFIIEAVIDGEAINAANQLSSELRLCGWKQVEFIQINSAPEGVWIETIVVNKTNESEPSLSAAMLVERLEANGWETRNGHTISNLSSSMKYIQGIENITNETVRIRVGNKPNPYFMNKLIAGTVNEQTQKMIKDSVNERKERREHLREKWGLPPRLP